MENIYLQGITPEQLNAIIQDGIKAQIQELKSSSKPPQPEKDLTRSEAAKSLSISLVTLSSWVKKGILRAYRIEGRVYIDRDSISNARKPIKF